MGYEANRISLAREMLDLRIKSLNMHLNVTSMKKVIHKVH